jgi:hypothetical protein
VQTRLNAIGNAIHETYFSLDVAPSVLTDPSSED